MHCLIGSQCSDCHRLVRRCSVWRRMHDTSQYILVELKAVDVGLRNSEYGIVVIQTSTNNEACDSVRRILVVDGAEVSQSSHMVMSRANNTSEVFVEW